MLLLSFRGSHSLLETTADVIGYMESHPSRAYLSQLILRGPYSSAMEVGVASGRFAEHFLSTSGDKLKLYYMIEPFPNGGFRARFPEMKQDRGTTRHQEDQRLRDFKVSFGDEEVRAWSARGIGASVEKRFFEALSTDTQVISRVPPNSVDIVYLDGAHNYKNVKQEMQPSSRMVSPCGMLAAHAYCNHGEPTLPCNACAPVPLCRPYTENGLRNRKPAPLSANPYGLVRAVQEWLLESHPELRLYHTLENFTRDSLARDGMNYDLVITSSYNPSWYFFKPR